MFTPLVITSKQADKDLNKIKVQHADLVQGIQDQAMRVTAFNTDREARKQMAEQQKEESQMQSEEKRVQMETKKLEAENKQKELAIKQQALSL